MLTILVLGFCLGYIITALLNDYEPMLLDLVVAFIATFTLFGMTIGVI